MERNENQSWKGAETSTLGVHCVSEEEDPVLGGETRMQALLALSNSMCLQGYHEKGGSSDGLHGDAG
jgi:hypothetical protein